MLPYLIVSDYFFRVGGPHMLADKLGPIMSKLFGTGKMSAAPFVLGMTGGYPIGAKCIVDLRKSSSISCIAANKLLSFCCGAGPAFTIGLVGSSVYGNPLMGLTLYAVQVISAVITGLLPIFPSSEKEESSPYRFKTDGASVAFVKAVSGCTRTAAGICCFIILFTVVLKAQEMILPDGILRASAAAFTELSTGCVSLAKQPLDWNIKFALTSAAISFGGLCVFMQTSALLYDAGLSAKTYLIGKLTHGILSFFLAYPLSYLFRDTAAAGSFGTVLRPFSPFPWSLIAFAMYFLFFLQIPSSIWRKSAL